MKHLFIRSKYGNLEILMWAREQCTWNSQVFTMAAIYGHLHGWKWALVHGCPTETLVSDIAIFTCKQTGDLDYIH